MPTQKFTDQNFEVEVLKSDKPVLVDFYADWCGPCQQMGPVIEELAGEFEGKAKIGKVNIDENKKMAEKYGIMSIPAILVFKDGKVVEQFVGFQGKEKLVDALNKALE